jgi:hypothetical protein
MTLLAPMLAVFLPPILALLAAGLVAAIAVGRLRVRPTSAASWASDEQSSVWPWLIGGTVLLLVGWVGWLALYLAAWPTRFPVPVYQPFAVALPFVFWATLGFLWNSKWFGWWVLGATLVFGALDAMWLLSSSDSSQEDPSISVAPAVLFANVLGFGLAATLAGIGLFERSRKTIALAYVVLSAVLMIIAFPYYGTFDLGEL